MICDSGCKNCIYYDGGDTCCFSWCIKEEADNYDVPGNYQNY